MSLSRSDYFGCRPTTEDGNVRLSESAEPPPEELSMNPKLRPGALEDAGPCGRILFEAFKAISSQHNFPWDLPSVEIATGITSMLLPNPGFYSVVAEIDGRIV